MRIDLHTHSSVSDGTDTPTQLVRKAAEAGLDVLGLTDHDTFDGLREARLAAEVAGIVVLPGIEMSCQLDGASVHLLGYGCDPHFEPLLDELARVRVGRSGRLPEMLAKLADLGLPLSELEIAEQVGASPSLGRPHVADAMVAKGYVKDRQEAFDRFLHEGGPAYANRYSCDLRRGVELVRRAGGVPVIAHPWGRGRDRELTPARLSELTMEYRLEGVEVDHPDHDADTRERLRALASRLGLLTLGSSDHHGLGKANNPLACETTDPDVYTELVRRVRARGGKL
jgi:3',5'-nucleoside bisphosphate phosphatase